MKSRFELRYMNKPIATGTVNQILDSIEEMKLIKPIEEKMRRQLADTGEYHFGMGLYHVTKLKNE